MCGIWLYLANINKKISHKKANLLNAKFDKIKQRGPDASITYQVDEHPILIGFHRLVVMGGPTMSEWDGYQPFVLNPTPHRKIMVICNGEIYNYKQLSQKYNITLSSHSDCEIIPHLYQKIGIAKLCEELDGEFAFIILDITTKGDICDDCIHYTGPNPQCYCDDYITADNPKIKIFVARDRFGIRPLFYSTAKTTNEFNFSSELKGLTLGDENKPMDVFTFPPRIYMEINRVGSVENAEWKVISTVNYYSLDKFKISSNFDFSQPKITTEKDMKELKQKIKDTFTESVINRLTADRPLGCLLSGGLDSSLIASIAARHLKQMGLKLNTFSIGLDDSTDEFYAKIAADFIGSNHTHIKFTEADFIDALKDVIYYTETYDITTIRASTGQYLISKWIRDNTDIKVLLIGDGSDELTAGYMYFHKAPSPLDLHNENIRLLEDIHYFDVLRADRCISANGLEARVPFLSHKFVDLYLSIDPAFRMPKTYAKYPLEKWLLREAFNDGKHLPEAVLFRKKEAFSDGVSSLKKSWYQLIQEHVDNLYSDELFNCESGKILHNQPLTKEALYYRKIWCEFYGEREQTATVIPYYWLPKWCGDIKEPSARVLSIYNSNQQRN